MNGRWWYLGWVLVVLACEQPSSNQRSVNPGRTASDAGADAASSLGETSASPTTAPGVTVVEPTGPVDAAPPKEAGSARPLDAGAPRVVYWGLQPGGPDPDAGLADEVLARLEVMAMGSRIMTHVSSGEQDDFTPILRAPDLAWIVTLPFDALIGMSDASLNAWCERVWLLGDAVRFLIFGQHLETDLVALPSAERDLLIQRLETALRQAKAHAAKPVNAGVGIGLALMAFAPTGLLAVSDVIAMSYSGIKATGEVELPAQAFKDFRGGVLEFSDHLPVIVQDLAYPSSHGAADQLAFFAAVHSWFRSASVPDVRAVVVSSLNPPAVSECSSWADDWRVSSGADARCSVGMRDVDGEPKPALNEVSELLAEFAQL